MAFALQPHPDKRTKNDLEAHWQLEHGCRSARDDASLIQHVLRKNEKKPCLVLAHFRSRLRVEEPPLKDLPAGHQLAHEIPDRRSRRFTTSISIAIIL
jgi:hypothetical protein